MTELENAALMALEALDEIHSGKRHPQLALAVAHNLRKALTQALATTEHLVYEDGSPGPATTTEPVQVFLVRDVAALLGASVPDVCKALAHLGHGQRSTNMEITPDEALAVAKLIAAPTERKGEPVYMTASAFVDGKPYNWREVSKDFYDIQEDRCRRVLYTSPQVPEGFALVPVEPTPKMIQRVRWLEYTESSLRMSPVDDDTVRAVWSDVIDAARKGE